VKGTIIKAYQSQSVQLTQIYTELLEIKNFLKDLSKISAQRDEQVTMLMQRKRKKIEITPMQNMDEFLALEQKLHDDQTFNEELVRLY